MSLKTRVHATTFKPLKNNVFVTDMESGMKKTAGGIILTDDNMTERGIRPRWGRVYAVGPEVTDLNVGEWVLVEHGRWTERIALITPDGDVPVWRIEYPQAALITSSEDPRLNQKNVLG
jgi:co-chaperonin GroES (HSP10)